MEITAMNRKLTLTIEQSVIEKAKSYAVTTGCSLSNLVENYLKAITKEAKVKTSKRTPIVQSLRGSFRPPIIELKPNLRDAF
jgi:hypothetical protein